MDDRLRHDYINSLPQPFMARLYGGGGTWPIYDIETQCALVRLDVVGKLQIVEFSDISEITDAEGFKHDPDDWWVDSDAATAEARHAF